MSTEIKELRSAASNLFKGVHSDPVYQEKRLKLEIAAIKFIESRGYYVSQQPESRAQETNVEMPVARGLMDPDEYAEAMTAYFVQRWRADGDLFLDAWRDLCLALDINEDSEFGLAIYAAFTAVEHTSGYVSDT